MKKAVLHSFMLTALVMGVFIAPPRAVAECIKIAAVGDIMMGTENLLPPDGGKSLFKYVTNYLKPNDIVVGNVEAPLTDRGDPIKVWPEGYCFRTPPHYAGYLENAGFNMISIANNHINDYGPDGLIQTIQMLEKHDMDWSGPPGTWAQKTVRGVKIGLAAFHSSSHSNWLMDIPEARKLIAELAEQNNVVIVSFHGGAEGEEALHVTGEMEYFMGEERGNVVEFARSAVDAGADLVFGHGPHVPRAMEIYKERLIAYSLGNFCTQKGIKVRGVNGLSTLLLAELEDDGRLGGGRVVSFYQTFGQVPRPDPQKRAVALIYQLGLEDFPETNAVDPEGRLKVDLH